MNDVIRRLGQLLKPDLANFVQIVDIVLVAFLLFWLLRLVRSTRAWRIFVGILIFVFVLFLSDFVHLKTLHWILEKATLLGPVALVILFLPELRQTLEGFAKLGIITDTGLARSSVAAQTIEEVIAAVAEMAALRIGAIIVFERGNRLDDVAANGVQVNATVSAALLNSVFYGANPLHDGAVILRGDRLVAAACRLPLSESDQVDRQIHMRHRAAIGIAEQSDCLVVVVSEERGTISLARDGSLIRMADHLELRTHLNHELRPTEEPKRPRRRRRKSAQPEPAAEEPTTEEAV